MRISMMKSMPYDDEIEASGCADGGQYLLELREHPSLYQIFVEAHRQASSMEPDLTPPPKSQLWVTAPYPLITFTTP